MTAPTSTATRRKVAACKAREDEAVAALKRALLDRPDQSRQIERLKERLAKLKQCYRRAMAENRRLRDDVEYQQKGLEALRRELAAVREGDQ